MPTEVEFEQAALRFQTVGNDAERLAEILASTDTRSVVTGGRIGTLVPNFVVRSSRDLFAAARLVHAAADTCRQRAAWIRWYQAQMAAYQAAYDSYEQQMSGWRGSYAAAMSDPTVGYGPQPVPPTPLAPPPAWAVMAGG